MVNEADRIASASVKPSLRTDRDIANLNAGEKSQAIKNAEHKAAKEERIHGAKK